MFFKKLFGEGKISFFLVFLSKLQGILFSRLFLQELIFMTHSGFLRTLKTCAPSFRAYKVLKWEHNERKLIFSFNVRFSDLDENSASFRMKNSEFQFNASCPLVIGNFQPLMALKYSNC